MASPRLLPVVAACASVVLGGCGMSSQQADGGSRTGHEQKQGASYANLIRHNYKPLSAAQSRRLVRYAASERSCLAGRFKVGALQVSRTRITIAVADHPDAAALAHGQLTCAPSVGPPP